MEIPLSAEALPQGKQILRLDKNVFDAIFYVFVITFLIWYTQYHWKRRKLYAIASKTDGPFALPFIGNAYYFMGSNKDFLDNCMWIAQNYASPFRMWLGQKLIFGIYKPQHLEIIMNSSHALKKDDLYKYGEVMVSTGLLTAPVPKWKRHRKIIVPTFNQRILDGFVNVFTEKAEVLVEQLQKVEGNGTFDIFHYVSRCTLDTICETAMGITVDAQTTDSDYVKWVDKALEITFMRMFKIWYQNDFIFNRTSLAREINDVTNKMHDFTGSVVREKRIAYQRKLAENREQPEALLDEDPKTRKTFLQTLIEYSENGAHFTDEELREEVDTFMIAGSDTSASTISFVFIMLGMFPKIQERVHEEVLDVLGPDRPVECKDLGKFVYLERVIKEALRLFPVAPLIVRAITQDIKLDNHIIPAGSSAVLFIMRVHMDPEIWQDPTKFDPDRFLPEEVAKRHPYSWLPFSGGPRNCVGIKYAMMAMKAVIATVIRRYQLSSEYTTIEDVKLKNDLVLKPVNGYKLAVESRQ